MVLEVFSGKSDLKFLLMRLMSSKSIKNDGGKPIEVFRNHCWPVCLLACQKDLNVEVILISEFTGSEIRITSQHLGLVRSYSGFGLGNLRRGKCNKGIRCILCSYTHFAPGFFTVCMLVNQV